MLKSVALKEQHAQSAIGLPACRVQVAAVGLPRQFAQQARRMLTQCMQSAALALPHPDHPGLTCRKHITDRTTSTPDDQVMQVY